jgi:hypothetical protein
MTGVAMGRGLVLASAITVALATVVVIGLVPGLVSDFEPALSNLSQSTSGSGVSSPPQSLSELNSSLNSTFYTWYGENSNRLALPGLNASTGKGIFLDFIGADSTGLGLLQAITMDEEAAFAAENEKVGSEFLATLGNSDGADGSMAAHTGYVDLNGSLAKSTADSTYYFTPGFSIQGNDQGSWLYLSVNYFSVNFHFFSVTYGENDVINTLWEGSIAQTEYNTIDSQSTYETEIDEGIIAALSVGLAFALPSVTTSLIAAGIIAAVLAAVGITLEVLASDAQTAYTNLYESTYANEPSGSKYLWLYTSVDFYYPWITGLGTFYSSAGFYGVLSTGSIETILGNYPFLDSTLAPALAGYGQSLGQTLGWNKWVAANPISIVLINGYSDTPDGNSWTETLSFTVPSGDTQQIFVWTVGDTATPSLTLPTGLSTKTSFGTSTGIAAGNLSVGAHSVTLSANGGWVNTATMAVYGVSNSAGYTFLYTSASQVTSLTLASGGYGYVGVEETGGTYGITGSSITWVNEETPPLSGGGDTDLIGAQTSDVFSFSTTAGSYGIAAAAIVPIATVQLLIGYAQTPLEDNWTYTLDFTVPAGVSEVLFAWTIADASTPTLTLPSGLSSQTSFGTSTGIASGGLAAGPYAVTLSGNGGWVNTVAMAVYVVSDDSSYTFAYSSAAQVKSLSGTSGAAVYIGILETGGTYPVTSPSLTTINEQTPSEYGGETDLIGTQSSDAFSFATTAGGYGIAIVGIFPPT